MVGNVFPEAGLTRNISRSRVLPDYGASNAEQTFHIVGGDEPNLFLEPENIIDR